MRFLFVVTIILQLAQYANAQYLTQYQHYYTPISGQTLTVTREHNVRFDAQGNIYTLMDRESSRFSILTCLNTLGNVAWIDTLKHPIYIQSAYADFTIKQQNLYALSTHGNNLNTSNAEALILRKYNLNGTQINQVVLNAPSTNYLARKVLVNQNNSILISYVTNNLQQNWTLHLDCYDTTLTLKWSQNFAWPSYSPTKSPMTTDKVSNTYITYTIDSTNGGNYYRQAMLHKIDSNGIVQWSKSVAQKRFIDLKVDQMDDLVLAGETIAPLVYVSNNIGDVFVTKLNTNTGNTIWETPYNSISNEKEIVYTLDIDANNRILIGGLQDIQDVTGPHYKGFANLYNFVGGILKNIILGNLDEVKAARFLSTSSLLLRSSTSTVMYLREYNIAGNLVHTDTYNFANGASWSSMDITATDYLAVAVSDVLCADRGVTVMRLSKTPLSIQDIEKHNELTLYPNPASDYISIESKNDILSIQLFDINGRMISNIAPNLTNIPISQLNSGLYLIQIKTTKDKHSISFFKN
jgi:outer membrane protein assembly factor BamB